MKRSDIRILFMGTPEFAVSTLDTLYTSGFNIVGVVTSTDKMGGRGGKQLLQSAVKKYAIEKGLKILQPKNLKAEDFQQELRSLKIDLQIVVAFRMLPEKVWNMPPMGTVNLHGSLLPKFRGAAPINWAIIRGEEETGVSTFKLKHEIDTGDIILQRKIPISNDDNVGVIYEKMKVLGAEAIEETIDLLLNDKIYFKPQKAYLASSAPKLNRENCKINFHDTVTNIHNFIRGLSPYPGAWFEFEGKEMKVYKANFNTEVHEDKIGSIQTNNKSYLRITCLDGFVNILDLKLQGKKRMDVKSFLNGYQFKYQ